MQTIKCKIIQEERMFDEGYVAEVKVIEGSNLQMIGFTDQVHLLNDTIIQLPIHLIQTCKIEKKCRLLFNTSELDKENLEQIVKQLQQQVFELKLSESSIFNHQPNCRKMVLIIDEATLFESLPFIESLSINQIETNVYVKSDQQQGELVNYLKQKLRNNINVLSSFKSEEAGSIFDEHTIGTNLFISGSWSMIQNIKEMAYDSGFTDEEIQYKGIGQKNEKVYCVKCYSYNGKIKTDEIECEHCNSVLDVSRHYSSRLDAYLGYVKDI